MVADPEIEDPSYIYLQGTSHDFFKHTDEEWPAISTGGSDLCVGWRVIVRREFQNWWWPIECEDRSFIYTSIVCVRCIMQQETSSWLHSYLAEVSWWSSSCDHVVWGFYGCFFLWDPLAPKATFVELPPSTNKSNVRYILNFLFLSIPELKFQVLMTAAAHELVIFVIYQRLKSACLEGAKGLRWEAGNDIIGVPNYVWIRYGVNRCSLINTNR